MAIGRALCLWDLACPTGVTFKGLSSPPNSPQEIWWCWRNSSGPHMCKACALLHEGHTPSNICWDLFPLFTVSMWCPYQPQMSRRGTEDSSGGQSWAMLPSALPLYTRCQFPVVCVVQGNQIESRKITYHDYHHLSMGHGSIYWFNSWAHL